MDNAGKCRSIVLLRAPWLSNVPASTFFSARNVFCTGVRYFALRMREFDMPHLRVRRICSR